jgi:hypothetical protein
MIKFFLKPCKHWGDNEVFSQNLFVKNRNYLILLISKKHAISAAVLNKVSNINMALVSDLDYRISLTSVYADAIEKICQDHGELSLKVPCITFFHGGTKTKIYFGMMRTGTVSFALWVKCQTALM